MNKLSELLTGIKILDEVESPYNGRITVIKSLAWGTYLQAGGLTQSGGIIEKIWNRSLGKVAKARSLAKVSKVLILGLGGGSIVKVIRNYWPDAKIVAVDIDGVIVKLGFKYLKLTEKEIEIVIDDAEKFLKSKVTKSSHRKFDLICIDLYRGDEFPAKFEGNSFLKLLKSNLTYKGIVVFNRLYYGGKRSQSVKFGNLLEKEFSNVDVVYPEANIMFVCNK